MKILGIYKNGNFTTCIYEDGTKIRTTEKDIFIPEFAENMDIKITNYCDANCGFCHEGSTCSGKHGDILGAKFIDTLHPYQEVALGGGDATSHPDLIPFLRKLKEKKVIANLTVNQKHFMEKQELIEYLVNNKLIYGLGVSLINPTDEFISLIQKYPNAVIHVINGVITPSDIEKLSNKNLKMLILGYKTLRRGENFLYSHSLEIAEKQSWLKENLSNLIPLFKVVSFDNLAIEQLEVQKLLSPEEWEEFYMGDDGTMTFYIDMVNQQFAKSSTADFNKRYTLLDNVDEMFRKVKEE